MEDDEILQRIDEDAARKSEAVRAMLIEAGRPDLAVDLDARLRRIRLGIDGAQGQWHAMSNVQRRALQLMSEGRKLMREPHSDWYHGIGSPMRVDRICRTPTVRVLISREMVDLEGGAFDPERTVSISERGRFTLKYGPKPPPTGSEAATDKQ
jgi:hypothetical protein